MYPILRDCYKFEYLTDRSVVVFSLLQVAGDHKYHPSVSSATTVTLI